ncbi:unnamed protein product (macronuclear) [Paramecium tetraurelia]|uniref:Uncharacterized protein n=1 Tax=Paramecium tetraurelia TaxID=5888 RepID=A0BN46_PARTE|nr:uncharacterized protein GSPATT00030601001 [Paramecium tetraurelia]CAK59963.1 unnamed protein product [Paramecium tetraurelia]|eukprot:XP_001427361.1 hypothetical protein (macronuclear) [Paramecium tetraurelia strain d4-2]
MGSKYLQKYPVSEGFHQILHDFAREINQKILQNMELIILNAWFKKRNLNLKANTTLLKEATGEVQQVIKLIEQHKQYEYTQIHLTFKCDWNSKKYIVEKDLNIKMGKNQDLETETMFLYQYFRKLAKRENSSIRKCQ